MSEQSPNGSFVVFPEPRKDSKKRLWFAKINGSEKEFRTRAAALAALRKSANDHQKTRFAVGFDPFAVGS